MEVVTCTLESTRVILVNFKWGMTCVLAKQQKPFQLILNGKWYVYYEKYKYHIDNIEKDIKVKDIIGYL